MSASDHLNPKQFFHGTHAKLSPGDMIEPGRAPNFPVDEHTYPEPNQVFFTQSLDRAGRYADRAGNNHGVLGHVYRVEPTGEYLPHHNEYRSGSPLRVVSEEDF